MSARTQHKIRAEPDAKPDDVDALRAAIADMRLEALAFVAGSRVQATALGLLPRGASEAATDEAFAAIDALLMATDLVLFAPSASGQTAFDRLARQRRDLGAEAAAAVDILRRSTCRLLRIERGSGGEGAASLRDLANGEMLTVIDEELGAELVGLSVLARVGALNDGRHVFVSMVTPLDDAALAVALGFTRPGARAPLPQRCAEAVYRHVLRHGTLEIPGLNRPPAGSDDDEPDELNALDELAERWAEPGQREPDDMQFVRASSDLAAIMDVIMSVVGTRMHGRNDLCVAYAEILGVQMDTVHRRQAAGSGSLTLERVAAAIDEAIALGMPPQAREVFNEARRRLGAARADGGGRDADLDRLIGRIQALRAKTVDQGCTEAEALAAAEKVAELLDRYGLSLSELDLQRQTCEGAAVSTSRKRSGPVDECVPAIAAFFDCRTWGEKDHDGTLRHIFFGLPADVAAARYLYELVELAFATEAASFRAGPTYGAMPSGLRRTASNSFGIGFSRGISAKLNELRRTREGAMRGATGRDLVVAKAEIVDSELESLGLRFRMRTAAAGRRVLQDAFQEGHAAGLGFEYRPGIA